MQRVRRVVDVEDRAEIPVEILLAAHRADVLRDAEEVAVVGDRVPALLGEGVCQLAAVRQVAPRLPCDLVRTVAEVRAGAEEGHDVALGDRVCDVEEVSLVDLVQ